ncbi:MAG TPA: 2-oxoglutarate dehydrogenase complex dihydrolipoyllysine-residue succinyltransferase [Planctomycetaceae bacterium]|jgi:2-oxoglutarate dehydrogenase E2 component (dihydrolipoamide succinyltransferase)|nr:2-oxoglutarate dehydrogenase complex dihydrolipoyllysine-residue succinyltransferase [Planctomycetaceae bacterium]
MSIELRIPSAGESIQEVQIGQWLKHEGDHVRRDETLVELDTDKASMELPSPSDGIISRIVKQNGEKVGVGEVIALIDPDGQQAPKSDAKSHAPAETPKNENNESKPPEPKSRAASGTSPATKTGNAKVARVADETVAAPSIRRLLREHHVRAQDVQPTGEGGRLLREDVLRYAEQHASEGERADGDREQTGDERGEETALKPEKPRTPETVPGPIPGTQASRKEPLDVKRSADKENSRADEVVPMSLVRRRIAERLVEARQTMALLTTFNEIDMTAVVALRTHYRETFQQKHGVKLGFVSFFVKASVEALRQFPMVNAEIRGTDIVYHHAYHIGVAIGAERGLVVPVIRDADLLSIAEVEQAIDDFAARAKSNKLQPGELSGGTFTISNGGIFGSLLSTPIVNPPQSAVLGMHAIQDRPVARGGEVVIRPMMYVALSYDHRLIDGREAVSFLTRVKQMIEDPDRLLLGV